MQLQHRLAGGLSPTSARRYYRGRFTPLRQRWLYSTKGQAVTGDSRENCYGGGRSVQQPAEG